MPVSRARTAPTRGHVHYGLLPKGPNGRALCRFCKRECPGVRQTFCSNTCVHEHKLRTNPGYVRVCVLRRDRGICAACRTDTLAVQAELLALPPDVRAAKAADLGFPLHRVERGALWDADHRRPVAEGGGEWGLDGYDTLCVPCHVRKSAVQRRAASRPAKPRT